MTPEPNRTKPCMCLSFDYKNATHYRASNTSIFYVYSTVKIIRVPPVTSANGLFQCTMKSELLPCQPSITFDFNPYLGSYYLTQPTAGTQSPGSSFYNAIESATNASVHIDTILTFRTPFTYLPSVGDRLEGLGYVPRSLLDWMFQQDAHTGNPSLLASCLPGGPPLGPLVPNISAVITVDTLLPPPTTIIGDTLLAPPTIGGTELARPCAIVGHTRLPPVVPVVTDAIGDMLEAGPIVATPGKDLTVSTAITVTNVGCFNPEACPTIRASRALEANSASGDFISNTLKPGVSSMTVARSKLNVAAGKVDKALPLLFTLGDQVFTPHPAGFSIDGTTISVGGRGLTIAGIAVQLESSGILKVGTSVVSMRDTAIIGDDLQAAAYSVGGQVFTPNWNAFRIGGTTISAEGPGVTIAGTPIRLEASGILKIGTSVASIANIASTTGHSPLASMGDEIFTSHPTASPVTRTTVSEAGSIITTSVTPANWETSGNQGTGASTPTLTPKHSVKASNSHSERNNNPIIMKRVRLVIIIYFICQLLAL